MSRTKRELEPERNLLPPEDGPHGLDPRPSIQVHVDSNMRVHAEGKGLYVVLFHATSIDEARRVRDACRRALVIGEEQALSSLASEIDDYRRATHSILRADLEDGTAF